jgi:hypothetical protein
VLRERFFINRGILQPPAVPVPIWGNACTRQGDC